jgi:hypothetical protein
MNDAALVRVGQGARDFCAIAERGLGRQPISRHHRVQGPPLDVLHGDVDLPVALARLIDRRDIWMVQRGSVLGLPQ